MTILAPACSLRPSRSRLSPVTRKSAGPGGGEGQQVVVGRIRAQRDLGKLGDDDGEVAQLVDEPAGERRAEARADLRVARHARQLERNYRCERGALRPVARQELWRETKRSGIAVLGLGGMTRRSTTARANS